MLFHWKTFVLTVDSVIQRRGLNTKKTELKRKKEKKGMWREGEIY